MRRKKEKYLEYIILWYSGRALHKARRVAAFECFVCDPHKTIVPAF